MDAEILWTYMNICRLIGIEPSFAGLREYNRSITEYAAYILRSKKAARVGKRG
jgi:hypothetical protein